MLKIGIIKQCYMSHCFNCTISKMHRIAVDKTTNPALTYYTCNFLYYFLQKHPTTYFQTQLKHILFHMMYNITTTHGRHFYIIHLKYVKSYPTLSYLHSDTLLFSPSHSYFSCKYFLIQNLW